MQLSVSVTLSTSSSRPKRPGRWRNVRSELESNPQGVSTRRQGMVLPLNKAMMNDTTRLAELEDSPQPRAAEIGSNDGRTTRRASIPKRQPSPTNSQASSTEHSDSTDSSGGGALLTMYDFDDPAQSAQLSLRSPRLSQSADTSATSDNDNSKAVGIASSQRKRHTDQPHRFEHEMDQIPPRARTLEKSPAHAAEPEPEPAPQTSYHMTYEHIPNPKPQGVANVPRAQQSTVPVEQAPGEEVQGAKQGASPRRRRGRRGRKVNNRRGEECERI